MDTKFSPAEWVCIEQHKYFLSEHRGCDVGLEEAVSHWLECHSAEWRQQQHQKMMELQRAEILRHKWIESEKAERDLGRDAALDWIGKYAAQWREWYEREFGMKTA